MLIHSVGRGKAVWRMSVLGVAQMRGICRLCVGASLFTALFYLSGLCSHVRVAVYVLNGHLSVSSYGSRENAPTCGAGAAIFSRVGAYVLAEYSVEDVCFGLLN